MEVVLLIALISSMWKCFPLGPGFSASSIGAADKEALRKSLFG